MHTWKRSLIVQLIGYYLLLSFVSVGTICLVAFLQAREALKQSIFERLSLTATLKEDELNRWIEDQREEISTFAQLPEVKEFAPLLLQPKLPLQQQQQAHQHLSASLTPIADNHSSLEEMLVLTNGGKVLFSTNRTAQNTYESLVQYSYLPQDPNLAFLPNFYPSPTTGQPRMTFATPVLDVNGKQIGVLATHLDLSRIDEIIRKRTGLGETGETYLVGNTLPNQGNTFERYNVFVSGESWNQHLQGIYSEGIEQAARGHNGAGVYLNYQGIEVLGVYRWLEKHDLALLAEISTQEAFAPARQLAQTIFFTGLGLAGLLAVGVYFGTRRIAHPILAITQTATQVAAGDLTSTAPVLMDNEIGTLARVFNQMIEQLRVLYTDLEAKVEERTLTLQHLNEHLHIEISERQRLETELRRSQQFLDSVINSIPLALFAKDVQNDFRYVLINQSSERVLGVSREQALGRNDYELIPPEQADYHRQEDQAALQHGALLEFPDHWIGEGPERILVRGWKLPLYDAEGQATHILAVSEDITERQHREQALRLIVEGTAATTGDEFFSSCVRYLAEVLQVRYAVVATVINEAKTRIRTLAFWQGDRAGDNFECNVQTAPCAAVLAGAVYYLPAQLPTLFPDAKELLAIQAESYLGAPLLGSSGNILGHLAVMDVKPMPPDPGRELILKIFAARAGAELERKHAETSLLVAKDAAEAANRAKSIFLANMSHELRTPLNAILGFAQLMERDTTLSASQREALSTINHSGEHLLNLINDVLEMSKIEAGRIVLNRDPFDLHRLLQTLYEMFQMRTRAKQLSITFDLAPDLPRYVLTDEGKLRQVLINLLGNAVKFTQTGGVTLRVSVEPFAALKLICQVEDTGCGIAPEDLDQLFQPFIQTMSGLQSGEGTGLGLAISHQFVRLMGGDLKVTSRLGQGSIFRFTIPIELAPPQLALPAVHRRVLHLAPGQPIYRVLVVDDRPENRLLMVRLLSTVGFITQTATNGEEAITQWQTWHPHLIWMDMRMPVMNGYLATQRIRELERSHRTRTQEPDSSESSKNQSRDWCVSKSEMPITKIIALTASAFEEQQGKILAAGCDDLVRKPYQEKDIFEKMAQHLGVRYLYDESTQPEPSPSYELTAERLATLPRPWLQQLHQVALCTDEQQMAELLQQLPDSAAATADALAELVSQFRWDAILDLTTPLIDPPSS
ncbi:MAG: response regulator [Synechococcales cyanobacterium C42_A2020_086]|jgi:PAS domain S-box-containing protein|nr:response regulator [Synechococcales cyanobacterium C42_A2020_086]